MSKIMEAIGLGVQADFCTLYLGGERLNCFIPKHVAQKISDCYNFFEQHNLAEVERKLAEYEQIATIVSKYTCTAICTKTGRYDEIHDIICPPKPKTTVGDLKPGGGDRVKTINTDEDQNVYIRPESCHNIDMAIKSGMVVMMYEKDNSLCLIHKDTPCEIVKG